MNQLLQIKNTETEPVFITSQVISREAFEPYRQELKDQLTKMADIEFCVEDTSSMLLDEMDELPEAPNEEQRVILEETMFLGFKALAYASKYTITELGSVTWEKLILERAFDQDGRLISFIIFFAEPGGKIEESYFVTSILHRKRNIASALLMKAHEEMFNLGITGYYITLVGSEGVYYKLGFQPIPAPRGDNDHRYYVSLA